jgi:hypothetical protein
MPLRKYIPAKQRALNSLKGDSDKPKFDEKGGKEAARKKAMATLAGGEKVPLEDLKTEKQRLAIILDKKKQKLLESKKK